MYDYVVPVDPVPISPSVTFTPVATLVLLTVGPFNTLISPTLTVLIPATLSNPRDPDNVILIVTMFLFLLGISWSRVVGVPVEASSGTCAPPPSLRLAAARLALGRPGGTRRLMKWLSNIAIVAMIP